MHHGMLNSVAILINANLKWKSSTHLYENQETAELTTKNITLYLTKINCKMTELLLKKYMKRASTKEGKSYLSEKIVLTFK